MNLFVPVFCAAFLYLIWTICAATFLVLYKWAKKRKALAIDLGMMMHVILPVPNVDKAAKQLVEKSR
jgi:hypothetical protein